MIIKKITLIALLIALFASCTESSAQYPTIGQCTGNNVRVRSEPNTASEILGSLNEYDNVIVLDSVKSGRNIWYEIDNNQNLDKAYVFGKYIELRQQISPLEKLLIDLKLTFGATPQKATLLDGTYKTRDISRTDEGNLLHIAIDLGDYQLMYLDGELVDAEVRRGDKPFGSIHVGDSTETLRRELGEPADKSEYSWEYQYGEMTFITFMLKDDRITNMNYHVNHEIH